MLLLSAEPQVFLLNPVNVPDLDEIVAVGRNDFHQQGSRLLAQGGRHRAMAARREHDEGLIGDGGAGGDTAFGQRIGNRGRFGGRHGVNP